MICKFPDPRSTWGNNTAAYSAFSVQPRGVWTASEIVNPGVLEAHFESNTQTVDIPSNINGSLIWLVSRFFDHKRLFYLRDVSIFFSIIRRLSGIIL